MQHTLVRIKFVLHRVFLKYLGDDTCTLSARALLRTYSMGHCQKEVPEPAGEKIEI